jgi:hypothetical protein
MVNAQADALGLTNLLSTGVQANKAGKPEISTGCHQPLDTPADFFDILEALEVKSQANQSR